MTTEIWEILEGRGLDVEALANKGWSVEKDRDGGSFLDVPFIVDGVPGGHKFRRFDNPDRKWAAKWESGPVAYNADCLKDDSLLDHPLIVCEGEIDLESFLIAGYQRVISPPNGCGGTSEGRTEADLAEAKAYEWFRKIKPLVTPERVKEIILATDGDEAGAKLMHELSLQFGRFRCKFITYPKTKRAELNRERTKDANEVLIEYGTRGLVETVNRAQWVQVKGVSLMSQLPPLPAPTAYEIGFPLLGENYKMRLGDFVVITGEPGQGKTTFVNDLCCRVAKAYDIKIAHASFEQSPQRDHKRALRSWFAEKIPRAMTKEETEIADKWIDDHNVFIVPDEEEDANIDWLLDCMEVAVVRYGVKVIVIDPYNEIEKSSNLREPETEYIGRVIRMLKRFAKKFQVHIILVAHPAKMPRGVKGKREEVTLYDIAGSAHFFNKCECGIIVHKGKEGNTIIEVAKSRYWDSIGKPGRVSMDFCKDDRRFRELERLA